MRKKDLPVLNRLVARTRELLYQKSIYKGKAFRVWTERRDQDVPLDKQTTMADPEFIDVSRRPANLVLNAATTELIRAALWTPIQQSSKTRHYGVGLRRGILLYGDFGTGKSLTAMETAAICELNGWTFIYVKDVRDLKEMYRFAARYAPAVLFAEDIDLVIGSHEDAGINMLNNVLDGVDTKNAEVITVLTTNFIDKLPTSLLRPGRFHTIVKYERPDRVTAARLVAQYAGNDLDLDNYDVEKVGHALSDNIPATIAEVISRAKLYALARTEADFRGPLKLNTDDILLSAASMKNHMALLNRPQNTAPNAYEQFAGALGESIVNTVAKALDTTPESLADIYGLEDLGDLRKRTSAKLLEPVSD